MSNLNKYIQNINESMLSDNKGELYEKLIYASFLYLSKNKIHDHNPQFELNKQLKKLLFEYKKIKIDKNIDSENKQKEKKMQKEVVYKKIKDFVIENGDTLNMEDAQDIDELATKGVVFLIIKKHIKLHDLDQILEKIKKYEKIKKDKKSIIDDKKQVDYANALEICKKFLKNKKINEKDIIGVEFAGNKKGQISNYWINLYPTKSEPLEIAGETGPKSENYKTKGTTSSIGKTDIILKLKNGKQYRLSLKLTNNQLASPSYVDIYTLIMHGINVFLKNISVGKVLNTLTTELVKKSAKTILSKMEKDRRQYIDNLKDKITITDQKTKNYATNIYIAILLELFIIEVTKKDSSLNTIETIFFKKNISDKTILDNVSKKFHFLFHGDFDSFEDNTEIKDLLKTVDIDFDKLKNKLEDKDKIIKHLIERQKEIRNNFKQKKSDLKISDTHKIIIKSFLKAIIKNSQFISKRLVRLKLNGFEYLKYFERIKILFNDINSKKYRPKEDEYEVLFNIKDAEARAEKQFSAFFSQNNNEIFNLLNINRASRKLKQIINENRNLIKDEIIKEAITGLYKFTGKDDFSNNNDFVATHILEFSDKKDSDIKIIPINTEEDLNKCIKQLGDFKFDFSVKGSGGQSYISMRIKSFLEKIKKKKTIQNSSYIYDYQHDIYNENFITDLVYKIKDNVNNIYDDFKIKVLNIFTGFKNKTNNLFKLFGLELEINKNINLPAWIVKKL